MVRALVASSTTQKQPDFTIISLVGFQGSGKSTIGKHLARLYRAPHLEVSSIVRSVHLGMARDELPSTAEKTKTNSDWLGELVLDLAVEKAKEAHSSLVVLTGVREPQIHKYLIRKKVKLCSFEIKADAVTRYNRVLELGKASTPQQFLNHELDEVKMGVREVMQKAKYAVITTEDTDPRKLARAMKDKLITRGVR